MGETLPVEEVYFLMNLQYVVIASVRCRFAHLHGNQTKYQPLYSTDEPKIALQISHRGAGLTDIRTLWIFDELQQCLDLL